MDTSILLRSCLRLVSRSGAPIITRRQDINSALLIRWSHVEKVEEVKDKPVKFTTSQAHIDYRATENFYSNDTSLPPSHNAVLAFSSIFGFIYMFLLRDDVEDEGPGLFSPIHETVPELAIPMLKSAIAQNKKFGYDTSKLDKKLAEYMKEPERYGQRPTKLVEN